MRFDYIKNRAAFYGVSLALTIVSVGAGFLLPLNLGIDMTGGITAEYAYTGDFDLNVAKAAVEGSKESAKYEGKDTVNNVNVYRVSGEDILVVEAGFSRLEGMSDVDYEKAKNAFKEASSAALSTVLQNPTLSRYVNVGESFGDYIKKTAYLTLALVIFFISIYIAYAFRGSIEGFTSFSFGFVTAVSLFHDVIVAFGLYVITSYFFPEYKIDTFFITAMLTILGYSINDTIVVMDRIRSNLRIPANKKKAFGILVNDSINDTMTRSIYTSFTVFITLVALFFFGPQAISGFILALIFGTVVGTYSSVCIAAPLLYDVSKGSKK
jgi:preprotein translocase subunit SecF